MHVLLFDILLLARILFFDNDSVFDNECFFLSAKGGEGGEGGDASLRRVVAASLSTLSESGFINYFGLQRFGTSATPTHVVGRSLLKKEFARSVELVLSSRLGSHVPPFPLQQRDVDSLFPKIAK